MSSFGQHRRHLRRIRQRLSALADYLDVFGQGRTEVLKTTIPAGETENLSPAGILVYSFSKRQRDGVCARSRVLTSCAASAFLTWNDRANNESTSDTVPV